jgi:transcriptional regulator with XRE-family HTH domain
MVVSAGVDMGDDSDERDSVLDTSPSVGAALRTTRQRLGRSLQDLAASTRIKRPYLEAIEEMRIEVLPSRPFTIGYVRAYARALGLDGEAAVQRFKQDVPGDIEPLRAPVGVRKHRDVRLFLLVGGTTVVILAIGAWNLARHSMKDDGPAAAAVVEPAAPSAAPPAESGAALAISAAQPAPQESTIPEPYVTPGMAPEADADAAKADHPAIDPAAPATFSSHGAVYGAPAGASSVVLQAKKSVSVVARGAGGAVYFAQQLKPGEAYRPPMMAGLSLEITDPDSVWVYVYGHIHAALNPAAKTGLAASVTPLSQILKAGAADAPPPPPETAPAPAAAAPHPAAAGPAPAAADSTPAPAAGG